MRTLVLSLTLLASIASTGCHLAPGAGKVLNLTPTAGSELPARAAVTPASASVPHAAATMPPTGRYGSENRGPLASPASCGVGRR